MKQISLYRAADEAADAYCREASERLGPMFATEARTEWNRDHWWAWASDMVVRHVTGEVSWAELGPSTFATVSTETPDRLRMLERLATVRATLAAPDLLPYAERKELIDEWAAIVNRLLDS